MADEKCVKIKADGTAEYVDADHRKANAVPGLPKDDDLCNMAYEDVKIPTTMPDPNGGGMIQGPDAAGIEFTCAPSDACNKKNKAANEKKKKLREDIDKQDKLIKEQNGIINGPDGKTPDEKAAAKRAKDAAKTKKAEAAKEKGKLGEELAKFPPQCALTFFVDTGGDATAAKRRLKLDDVKAKKIQYAFCKCQDMAALMAAAQPAVEGGH